MRVRLVIAALCLGLAACQMPGPFRKDQATPAADAATATVTAAPGAIMGGTITATPITPGAASPPAAAPAGPGATVSAAEPSAASEPTGNAAAPETAPPENEVLTPPPVPEPKTEAQLACERKKGTWTSAGKGFKSCVFRTRDGGQACRKESDCDGVCLARSGTCSPVRPLFGCNDILDSLGRKVTLCID